MTHPRPSPRDGRNATPSVGSPEPSQGPSSPGPERAVVGVAGCLALAVAHGPSTVATCGRTLAGRGGDVNAGWWRLILSLSHPTAALRASPAAPTVCSMSASVWAAETNAASNWLQGRYTPRASISQKKRAKSDVSERLASS